MAHRAFLFTRHTGVFFKTVHGPPQPRPVPYRVKEAKGPNGYYITTGLLPDAASLIVFGSTLVHAGTVPNSSGHPSLSSSSQ